MKYANKYLFTLLLVVCPLLVFVQNVPKAVLEGIVTGDAGETLIGASVKVFEEDRVIQGSITDLDGCYRILLDPGVYSVECSYTGFASQRTRQVIFKISQSRILNFNLTTSTLCEPTIIRCFPYNYLIDQDPGNTGVIFKSSELRRMY
jgi:hypothetical protein